MPRGDQTGPNGQGAMTGRAMGYCAGYEAPGYANPCFNRGFGRGRGFARRARFMPMQQVIPIQQVPVEMTEKQEKQFLEQELEALKQEMNEIEKRLKEIKK
jgi:hypothetical protein